MHSKNADAVRQTTIVAEADGCAMRNLSSKLMFLVLFCFGSLLGSAFSESDGNRLIVGCHSAVRMLDGEKDITQEQYSEVHYCMGLVHGIADVLVAEKRMAAPADMSQMLRGVDRYLHNHPEELSNRDSILVVDALRGSFPAHGGKVKNK